MKEKFKGLLAGILIGAILTGGAVFAATGTKTIDVTYSNIKVYKDNVLCELKDSNGTVIEPFIYNGTTYMPVRGTANLADMEVTWDGATKSVYLWDELFPEGTYFMEACPPYATSDCKSYYSSDGDSFSMAGKKYSDGITCSRWHGGYALFNLDSRFSEIECTVGHTGEQDYDKEVSFFVDGKLVKTVELDAQCMPKTVSIPVSYGLQLKISTDYYTGVGNITVK